MLFLFYRMLPSALRTLNNLHHALPWAVFAGATLFVPFLISSVYKNLRRLDAKTFSLSRRHRLTLVGLSVWWFSYLVYLGVQIHRLAR